MALDDLIASREEEGYEVVQSGRISRPYEHGVTFAERAEGCNVSLIESGDALVDDEERWVHMKRKRKS
jgi:hypothetical protein